LDANTNPPSRNKVVGGLGSANLNGNFTARRVDFSPT
jgi:hypothetical protein